jgi:hypothetical protein
VLIPGTKLTIPLALDWSFDPAVDENPTMSFEAGSRRDEDWQENDNLLKEGCGSENSYGISLILPDETIKKLPPSQLSSSILKIDNIVQMGHEVIILFQYLLNIAASLMTQNHISASRTWNAQLHPSKELPIKESRVCERISSKVRICRQ